MKLNFQQLHCAPNHQIQIGGAQWSRFLITWKSLVRLGKIKCNQVTKNFSCRLFSIIFSRECDAGQNLFSALATNVNKVLREGVENNEEYDYTKSDVKLQDTNIPNILASLAKNETKVDTLLEEVWEKFGTFLDPDLEDLKNHLSKEILGTANETTII